MRRAIPEVPEKLVQAVLAGKVVLFAGSGISRGVVPPGNGAARGELPGWAGLLLGLLARARASGHLEPRESTELRKAVKDQKYLFAAETIKARMGTRDFYDALETIFRDPGLRPAGRHEVIRNIPFAAIVTTNYDKLLESAYATQGQIPATYTFDNAPDIISALGHNRFFILKAHGDIDRKETVILSERDYRDILYRQPGYRAALNTIFITKTVLFVGANLTDVDVKLVLESVSETFSGRGPGHFALLPEGETSGSELLHWRGFFCIQIIPYAASGGHPEVDGFLEALRRRVRERTPQRSRG